MLFCTVARKQQMANAIVWAKAIRYYHPDCSLILGMLEHSAPPDQLAYFDEAVFLSNQGVPAVTTESGCAAKTAFIKNTLDTTHHEILIYLDPETRMYTPFEELHQLLQTHSIVAVPYLLEPGSDPSREAERIHKGVLNAGIIGLRNTPEARSFADWWAHVVHESFNGPEHDLFADNRWLDVTMDIHDIHILKDPAYGLCAWNIPEQSRNIFLDHNGVKLVNGRWVRSVNFNNPDGLLDREMLKLEPRRREPLKALIEGYRQEVKDAVPLPEPVKIIRRKKTRIAKRYGYKKVSFRQKSGKRAKILVRKKTYKKQTMWTVKTINIP